MRTKYHGCLFGCLWSHDGRENGFFPFITCHNGPSAPLKASLSSWTSAAHLEHRKPANGAATAAPLAVFLLSFSAPWAPLGPVGAKNSPNFPNPIRFPVYSPISSDTGEKSGLPLELSLPAAAAMTTNLNIPPGGLSAFNLGPAAAGPPTHTITVKSESPDPQDRRRGLDLALGNASAPAVASAAPTPGPAAPAAATVAKREKKLRRGSLAEDKVLVSTSSPEGIAAAGEITPHRIAQILLREGPLPIRHLTAHLVEQVPTFGSLSLSKQRRLIMSALESGDLLLSAVFEKIGWGQWEARVVDAESVRARITRGELAKNAAGEDLNGAEGPNRVFRKRKSVVSGTSGTSGTSGVAGTAGTAGAAAAAAAAAAARRESITNPHTEHNLKMPASPTLAPIQSIRNSLRNYDTLDEALDEAIESSSSFSDEDADVDVDADHSGMYSLNRASPPMGRSVHPRSSSTSLPKPMMHSSSISSSRRPSFVAGITKPVVRKPRVSFTQHTIEAALDETPDRPERRVSFTQSAAKQSFLRTRPVLAMGDESAIDDEYTDEEDWEALGAHTLRNSRPLVSPTLGPPGPSPGPNARKADEELAASALVDMKS